MASDFIGSGAMLALSLRKKATLMPRYYFDVKNGRRLVDPVGWIVPAITMPGNRQKSSQLKSRPTFLFGRLPAL